MTTQSAQTQARRPHAAWALAAWLILCFAVAGIASMFCARSIPGWYGSLIKPPLSPPEWVFPLAWIVLSAPIAVAAWLVWKTRDSGCRRRGLSFFWVQLWFNFLWSWIFFSRHQLGAAFADIAVLWIAVLLVILQFRKMSRSAAWLLAPYLGWITFVGYLSLALFLLN